MKSTSILIFILYIMGQFPDLDAQSSQITDAKHKNFSCDIESGVCKPVEDVGIEEVDLNKPEKVKMIYYTDPICSACWAIEPQLKKFKLAYGEYVEIEYRMGGLLPGWEGFADRANGISKPTDVAHHWDEVGEHTGMSIDGDIWLEDPLDSSFPPSIAFKAAQKQGKAFALNFLRNMREQLFLEKQNISREEVLVKAIEVCRGNSKQFLSDYHDVSTKEAFYEEMNQGKSLGVRGFPTFIFLSKEAKGFKLSGMSGYENYVRALEKAYGEKIEPKIIPYSSWDLIKKYKYLATQEITFVLSQDEASIRDELKRLVAEGKIKREQQKFGDFWRLLENAQ
ncbi:MAG: DsbA family protein [Bacteroidota bacterium]